MNINILNKNFNSKKKLNVSDDIKYIFYKKNFINWFLFCQIAETKSHSYYNFDIFIFFIFIFYIIFSINNEKNYFLLNQRLKNNSNKFNLKFDKNLKKKINIGIYAFGIKNGGRARSTSLLINNIDQLQIFNIFLFTKRGKEKDEYQLPNNLKRITIKDDLIKQIKKNKLDILIYQLSIHEEIEKLNNLHKVKVIFYLHLGVFDWIYGNYNIFKTIYRDYINSKYVINIIPYENDYLFKEWGVKSILMDNFMTYEFEKVIPSNLITKKILMIGRGDAKKKRFEKGIQAMEYIIEEIPESELTIISDLNHITNLVHLISNINLENKIKLVGYTASPELFFQNASLNLFPSISEAFPLVMCETKIYGIPNVLLGLDYTSISKGGTFIIYDETSESLGKVSINILKNQTYKNILGENAKKSMKKFNNNLLLKKWIKLIICIYNGDEEYESLKKQDQILSYRIIIKILNSQIQLLKKRIPIFNNITINIYKNFHLMEKYKIK